MAKTIEQLKAQGAEVKNASVVGENTATRVGTLFNDIVEHVEDYEAKQAERDTQQDNTAASLVNAEAEARTLAISQEAQTRAKNDENLNKAIVAETTRAKAAEEANAEAIAEEAEARTLAISQEAQTRAKNDEQLNGSINAESNRAKAAEKTINTELNKKIDATNFNNQLKKKAGKDEVAASIIELERKIGERTEILGDVVNNPDEEDLTTQEGKLKLKDRAYEPLTFSGKGYKILRKNMTVISVQSATITVLSAPTANGYISVIVDGVEMHINVTSEDTVYILCEKIAAEIERKFSKFSVTYTETTVELTGNYEFMISDVAVSGVNTGAKFNHTINENEERNVNVLRQEDFSVSHTVYEIRYDFNLNGKEISIPEGCLLKFDGGSISNGTVKGSGTFLEDRVVRYFDGVKLSGTWIAMSVYPEWFGAIGNDSHDDTVAFKSMCEFVNAGNGKRIVFAPKTYRVEESISIVGDLEICGFGANSVIHTDGRTTINIGRGISEYELLDTTIVDNVGYGESVIKVTDVSKFQKGEYYVIQDTVDFSFEASRAYYRQGEIIRVKDINAEDGTITLYRETAGKYGNDDGFLGTVPYDRNNFTGNFQTALDSKHRTIFVKWEMHECYIHDFSILSDTTYECYAAYALSIRCLINSKIERIHARTNKGARVAMRCDMMYNTILEQLIVSSYVTVSGDNYGLGLGDMQNVHVKDCIVGGLSHSLATGSIPGIGGIVNRFFIYENIKIEKPAETINKESVEIDVHAGAEKYIYKNINLPEHSCDTGGYDMLIDGCTFYNISTSFHTGGMFVRNCNVIGYIGTLFYFFNPWRDWSNEDMIIENSNINRIEIDPQAHTQEAIEKVSRLENLVIRNSIINNNIYARYYPAKNIIIENNIVKARGVVYESITFNNRIIKPNEDSCLVIRNNKISCNSAGIFVGYTLPVYTQYEKDKLGYIVIEGNDIISIDGHSSVNGIFIANAERAFIMNNRIDVNASAVFMIDNERLLFDYNYVSENVRNSVENATNNRGIGTLHEIGRHNDFRISKTYISYADNIKIPFGLNSLLKYVEKNLSAADMNYKYRLLDGTKEELTWDGEKWLTSDRKINGKRSGAESNMPTIKAQDIQNGATTSEGEIGLSDKGYEYILTSIFSSKKIIFTATILDEVMTNQPSSGEFRENPFEEGCLYYVNSYGIPGYNVYFAKNNTETNTEDMREITEKDGFFIAPNQTEYPYIYALGGGYFYTKHVRLWTEEDGAAMNVTRSGSAENRPNGREIYIGFRYMDTEIGKPIFAKDIKGNTVTWVDASGATV